MGKKKNTNKDISSPSSRDVGFLRKIQADYCQMDQLIQNDPELAEDILRNDVSELRALLAKRYCSLLLRCSPLGQQRSQDHQLALRYADSSDFEAQKNFENVISKKRIVELYKAGLVHNPTTISRMVMPNINVVIWGIKLKAIVDISARSTIMSSACAERCGLMLHLVKTYKGVAHGAGQLKILGEIQSTSVKIGGEIYLCSFWVLDSLDMDLLVFGRDMLYKYQCIVHSASNAMVIREETVISFLEDEEEQAKDARLSRGGRIGFQMLEVFHAVINKSGDLWGEISVFDGSAVHKLYDRDSSNCERIEFGQCASLTGPSYYLQADDRFSIYVELYLKDKECTIHKVEGEIHYNPYYRFNEIDRIRNEWFTGGHASVALRFAVLRNALEATVTVEWKGRQGAILYGLLNACSDKFSERPTTTLFKHSSGDPIGVGPDGIISLSRSVVAVSLGYSLVVHACLKDRVSEAATVIGFVKFPAMLSGKLTEEIKGKNGSILVTVTFSGF